MTMLPEPIDAPGPIPPPPGPADAAIALRRLVECSEAPRALAFRPEDRARIRRAAERAAAQLTSEADCILTIALAGGSGVGKSTLINALAGAPIAEAGERRPCTMQPTIYHHREVPGGGLPAELAATACHVAHDRPELRFKVIIDTPDLDTFATENRAATRALLKAAGLVIYLFTPEKYWDERVWSVIREEQRFSACLALLNKADLVPPAALERAAEEIRRRFAAMGKPDIAVLRTCALRHVPGAPAFGGDGPLDEMPTLRAFIEHELRDGDIARMRREQRLRVVDNLRDEIDRVAPLDLPARLDALSTRAALLADESADSLAETLSDRLSAVEAELRPLLTVRRHRRFFGPFRVWLAVGDFLTYSLPKLVRRLRAFGGPGGNDAEAALSGGSADAVEELSRGWSARLRDAAYGSGLPVERWRDVAGESSAPRLLGDIGREVQARFDAAASARSIRVRVVAWVASVLGLLVPMGLAAWALFVLVTRLNHGEVAGGFEMLWLVAALTVLSYILIHGTASLALLGTTPPPIHDAGRAAVHTALRRLLGIWVTRYRADIDADLAELREPLEHLHAVALAPIAPPRPPPTLAITVAADASAEAPISTDTVAISAPTEPVVFTAEAEAVTDVLAESRAPLEPVGPADIESAPSQPGGGPPALRPSEVFRQAVQRHTARSSEK
jgi:energy-coupling factor transporter ATP-binding protein EcfA2